MTVYRFVYLFIVCICHWRGSGDQGYLGLLHSFASLHLDQCLTHSRHSLNIKREKEGREGAWERRRQGRLEKYVWGRVRVLCLSADLRCLRDPQEATPPGQLESRLEGQGQTVILPVKKVGPHGTQVQAHPFTGLIAPLRPVWEVTLWGPVEKGSLHYSEVGTEFFSPPYLFCSLSLLLPWLWPFSIFLQCRLQVPGVWIRTKSSHLFYLGEYPTHIHPHPTLASPRRWT